MIRVVLLLLVGAMALTVSSCITVEGGGGRVESCGINMRYCSPGP